MSYLGAGLAELDEASIAVRSQWKDEEDGRDKDDGGWDDEPDDDDWDDDWDDDEDEWEEFEEAFEDEDEPRPRRPAEDD